MKFEEQFPRLKNKMYYATADKRYVELIGERKGIGHDYGISDSAVLVLINDVKKHCIDVGFLRNTIYKVNKEWNCQQAFDDLCKELGL